MSAHEIGQVGHTLSLGYHYLKNPLNASKKLRKAEGGQTWPTETVKLRFLPM